MIKIKQIHYTSDKGRLSNDSMFYAKKFLCKEYEKNINNQDNTNDNISDNNVGNGCAKGLNKLNNSIDDIIKLSKSTEKIHK